MHWIREMAGSKDIEYLTVRRSSSMPPIEFSSRELLQDLFQAYFCHFGTVDKLEVD